MSTGLWRFTDPEVFLQFEHSIARKLNQPFVLVYGLQRANAIRHQDKQNVTWKGLDTFDEIVHGPVAIGSRV